MRIGASLPTSGPLASSAFIRGFARTCEDWGYDTVWMSDHVTWTAEDAAHHLPVGSLDLWREGMEPQHYDPMATLSYLAGMTSRVRLGTGILVLPVRNPVVLAKEAASLDELSGGRLMLGVGVGGTGFADAEFGAVGAQPLRRHRGRVMDEWIEIMRGVWSQPSFRHDGEFIQVGDTTIYPKPRQPGGPPILVGGDSPTALERVARHADGSLVTRLAPARVAQRREQLADLAKPHGRSGIDFHLAVVRWLSIADHQGVAEAAAEPTLAGMRRGGRAVTDDVLHFVGTPDRLREMVAEFHSAGVDEVILQVIGASEAAVIESLQRFREEVLDEVDGGPA